MITQPRLRVATAAFLVIAGLVAARPVVAEESPLRPTLTECVELAVRNSRALRSSVERQASAGADADQARAARWPVLSIDANGRYVSAVNEFDLPTVPPRTVRFGDHDSYDVAASVRVPLYTGGAQSATIRARRAVADAAAYDVATARLRLVRDVRHAFLATLGADEGVRAAELAVDRLRRHVDELTGRIDLGAATTESRLEAEARLRIAEQLFIGAQEQRNIMRLRLGSLLGRPGHAVTPTGSLDDPVSALSLDVSVDASVEERPELHAWAERERSSDELRRAVASRFLPTVSAVAEVHYGKPGPRVTEDQWMDWTAAGLSLTWTLWDAGSRAADVRGRAAETRAIIEASAEVREGLESALAVARERLAARRAQKSLAESRVRLETERLALVDGRSRQGMGTESERLDVRDDLTEAEVALAAARADLRIAEAELLYAVGQ